MCASCVGAVGACLQDSGIAGAWVQSCATASGTGRADEADAWGLLCPVAATAPRVLRRCAASPTFAFWRGLESAVGSYKGRRGQKLRIGSDWSSLHAESDKGIGTLNYFFFFLQDRRGSERFLNKDTAGRVWARVLPSWGLGSYAACWLRQLWVLLL